MRALLVIMVALVESAHADPACDHLLAVADANAALLSAPELFATAGSMPRSDFSEALEPRLVAAQPRQAGFERGRGDVLARRSHRNAGAFQIALCGLFTVP